MRAAGLAHSIDGARRSRLNAGVAVVMQMVLRPQKGAAEKPWWTGSSVEMRHAAKLRHAVPSQPLEGAEVLNLRSMGDPRRAVVPSPSQSAVTPCSPERQTRCCGLGALIAIDESQKRHEQLDTLCASRRGQRARRRFDEAMQADWVLHRQDRAARYGSLCDRPCPVGPSGSSLRPRGTERRHSHAPALQKSADSGPCLAALWLVIGRKLRERDVREVASDVVQLRIDEAAAEGPIGVGSIVVLVTLRRRLKACQRENERVHGLA